MSDSDTKPPVVLPIVIPLKYPVKLGREEIAEISINKRPTVNDAEAVENAGSNSITQAKVMLTRLTGLNPGTIGNLDLEDMVEVQSRLGPLFESVLAAVSSRSSSE